MHSWVGVALLCGGWLFAQPVQYRFVRDLAGSGQDTAVAVAMDAAGNTYITGSTTSPDFPVKSAWQPAAGSTGLLRIQGGQAAWDRRINWSSVLSVAQDPSRPATLYAATSKGVLRSLDGSLSWTDWNVPAQVNRIAVDPSASNILYAAAQQQGVLKSTDAGATWTQINNGLTSGNDGKINAYWIGIDPRNPAIVYAGTDRTLARSTDGGATWIETLGSYSEVAFDPFTPGVVYAINANGYALSRSADSGATFTPVLSVPLNASYTYAWIALDPRHKDTIYVGGYSGLYKSSDGGATWTQKLQATVKGAVIDPSSQAMYAVTGYSLDNNGRRLLMSTDGFETTTPVGPPAAEYTGGIVVSGNAVLAAASVQTDVFVTKLDPRGEIVYSTYVGGSSSDDPTALTVDAAGNVYVAGKSASLDLPVTAGAFRIEPPNRNMGTFLFRLNGDGNLAWCSWFSDTNAVPAALAVDAQGNPAMAGTATGSGMPVTAGVLQPQFIGVTSGKFIFPLNAFLAKFRADGSGLVYSTYVGQQSASASALALDSHGNAYLGGNDILYRVNPDATQLLGSGRAAGTLISAIAIDRSGRLFIAGSTNLYMKPYTTPGAFQTSPRGSFPLPGEIHTGNNGAFVTRLTPDFAAVTASTLLGGEGSDAAAGIAFDPTGNVIVAGTTNSQGFPTRAPFQGAFANATSFVSVLNPDLTDLAASTYAGDTRPYSIVGIASGTDASIAFAGNTYSSATRYAWFDPAVRGHVIAAALRFSPAPGPRIDAVLNAASLLATPMSPGETLLLQGSGFSADSTVTIDGVTSTVLTRSAGTITAVIPDALADRIGKAVSVQVTTAGTASNAVLMPVAAAAPGVFANQILNEDGTINSASNPAAQGSIITIQATGVGAGPVISPSVFIDGFYASGVDDAFGTVTGLPGNVYRVRVHVPRPSDWVDRNPDLRGFQMPPQVALVLQVAGASSQPGLGLYVK